MMLPSEQALAVGMVDEIVPLEDVVRQAVARCERLVSLPPQAMSETRAMARPDLVQLFEGVDDRYLDQLVDLWFSDETQAALTALVKRLSGG